MNILKIIFGINFVLGGVWVFMAIIGNDVLDTFKRRLLFVILLPISFILPLWILISGFYCFFLLVVWLKEGRGAFNSYGDYGDYI